MELHGLLLAHHPPLHALLLHALLLVLLLLLLQVRSWEHTATAELQGGRGVSAVIGVRMWDGRR